VAVTVIIPTLNEEEWIAGAVESARAAGAAEVIVSDGGSLDRTTRFATAAGARMILADRMRSKQLNRGVESASNDTLIFLHADSRLPIGAAAAVEEALSCGTLFGGFRLRFIEKSVRLRVAERMVNLRTKFTRCPWGDQAPFIRRDTFVDAGGFREIPLMEDYEMAARMKARGLTRILPLTVLTSGRRFLQRGLWRTAMTNWDIVMRFRAGEDPISLAARYRK
jgi:rSAM/selenodomain-associated transferase 2